MPDAEQTNHLAIMVQAAGTLVSLGIAGWAKWSVRQVAREEAREMAERVEAAMKDHDEDEDAHRPLVKAWEESRDKALTKLTDTLTAALRAVFTEALAGHNRDPWVHPEAYENRTRPVMDEIKGMRVEVKAMADKLEHLSAQHEALVKNGLCPIAGGKKE